MSAAKHTPGPWQVVCHSWHASSVYSKDMDTIATCVVPCVDDEPADSDADDEALKDANARLIAAAPELLAALTACAHELDAITKASGLAIRACRRGGRSQLPRGAEMSAADFTTLAQEANDEAARSMESLLAVFTLAAVNLAIWAYVLLLVAK